MPGFLKHESTLYVLLTGALLGSTLVLSRFGLGQFDAMSYVSLRLVLASVVFLIAYFVFRVRPWPRDPKLWLAAGIFGLVSTAITMTAFTNSLKYQSSGITSLLTTLSPIITGLLAQIFLKDERLNRLRLIGAVIAFGGAALLLVRGENGLSEFTRADWRGYAWALLGVFTNSVGLVYARRYLRDVDSFVVTSIRVMVAAVTVVLITGLTSGFDFSRVEVSGMLAAVYAAAAGTFFAFLYYLKAVQKFGATVASQVEYVVPMVATSLGVLLLNERVTAAMLVGMAVIFVGLAIFDRGKEAPVKPPLTQPASQ